MVASLNDMALLATDQAFVGRVRAALIQGALSINLSEAATAAFHAAKVKYANAVLNNPDAYKQIFAGSLATDANIIADATSAGTVALTSGNLVAQAAAVTDAHITAALGAQFSAFFNPAA